MDVDHRFPGRVTANAASRARAKALDGLIDAQAMHRKHPRTFQVPTAASKAAIKPGDFVKVARNDERFWVRVTGFEKRRIHGAVDNKLKKRLNKDLPLGKKIYFQKKHIYAIDFA